MMFITKSHIFLLLFASNNLLFPSAYAASQSYIRRGQDNGSHQRELGSNNSKLYGTESRNENSKNDGPTQPVTLSTVTNGSKNASTKKTTKSGSAVQTLSLASGESGPLHTKKNPKQNPKQQGGAVGIYNFGVASPTPPPTKSRPSLADWIDSCVASSSAIDNCITAFSNIAKPENCKMCLKGLASFADPPPPEDNGVKLCADGPTCGQCTKEDVKPFYSCGLSVDKAFFATILSSNSTNSSTPTSSTDSNSTTDIIEDTLLPPVVLDKSNCPALWPGTGTVCVMLPGFNAKECVYPEYSKDAVCKCSNPMQIWDCVNKPESLTVGTGIGVSNVVGNLVDKDSLSQPPPDSSVMVGTVAPPPIAGGAIGDTDPLPVIGIDAMINSLP